QQMQPDIALLDLQLARMTTLVLGGACALLLVTMLIQLSGYGRGYGWLPPEQADTEQLAVAIDRQPFALPPQSTFDEVEARPLFNEDRKPTPIEVVDAVAEVPQVPLNVTLTGIILVRKTATTPELRIAMVRDNARNESLALKVGMPLSGDQAGWTLESLGPRMARFKSSSDELSEIELQTAAVPMAAPVAVKRPQPVLPGAPGSIAPERKEGGAESDLAKRIEERRRQMREEAERLRAERGGNVPADQKQ
ncbi:MAG: hypothetical protein ABI650_11750, partial [Dokdonella sp.]